MLGVKGSEVREPGRLFEEKPKKVKHLAIGKKIKLKYDYAQKYSGGGANGLINGLKGTRDYRDGIWQGYEGVDLVATIDLGNVEKIKEISCGFLQQQVSWIFFPKFVQFETSTDGAKFNVVKIFDNRSASEKFDIKAKVKDFIAKFEPQNARYVRVVAKNIGVCPDWHPGAGGKAWIFADEIVVK